MSLICGDSRDADQKDMGLALTKPIDSLTLKSDERFLVGVVEFNYKQILLGKLAQQRATSIAVKELAKMLEEDHRNPIMSYILAVWQLQTDGYPLIYDDHST